MTMTQLAARPGQAGPGRSVTPARCLVLLLAALHAPDARGADLLIRNARLFDGTGGPPRDGAAIRIHDGRIAAIAPDLPADGAPVLDAEGGTVLPGLIDAHVHLGEAPGGSLRKDAPDVVTTLIRRHLRAYLACGVTTVLDAGIAPSTAAQIQGWLGAGEPGPRFLTLGPAFLAPGGFLSQVIPGVATVADVEAVFAVAARVGAAGADVLLEHGWAGLPGYPTHRPEIREAIVRGAAARGLPIYVHATSEEDQLIALDMGAHALLQPLLYRQSPPSDALVQRLARAGTYQVTTLAVLDAALIAFHPERLDDPLVQLTVPPVELATARDPETSRIMARELMPLVLPWLPRFLEAPVAGVAFGETAKRSALELALRAIRRLHDGGVRLVAGSDTGRDPWDLHGPATLRELVLLGEAGLTPSETIMAATRVPAEMLGLAAEIGTVEIGKRADLVIVRDDPLADLRALRTVRWTVRDGVARTPAEWVGARLPYAPRREAPEAAEASGIGRGLLVVAGAFGFLAFLWALASRHAWHVFRRRAPEIRLAWIPPLVSALAAVHYTVSMLRVLVMPELTWRAPAAYHVLSLAGELSFLATNPLFRHLLHLFPRRVTPPSAAWLGANYGSAALVMLVMIFPGILPLPTSEMRVVAAEGLQVLYLLANGVLVLRQLRPITRRGGWRAGGLGETRSADLALLACGVLAAVMLLFLVITGGNWSILGALLDLVVGFMLVAPFVVRILGEVVRQGTLALAAAGAAGVAYFAVPPLTMALPSAPLRHLADFAAVAAVAVLLTGGQPRLRAAIDRLVFRRRERRRAELQSFLQGISPELGTLECCRGALDEVGRVMQLRGAAILLRDGERIGWGDLALPALERAWPADEALPSHPLVGWYQLRDLPAPLVEALIEADVVGLLPIAGPRRAWGHLVVSTGLLGATFADDDAQALQAFAEQLALVLDAADLLARAVGVERSLAHAEKLAAIGELAARVAHEIRNPVTAARSLAQQLAHEAGAPFQNEHRLILAELERVERQVAALLRFSRREDLTFAPVDLGALACETLEASRARLERAGILLDVEAAAGVTARGDREKLRQVLVNLVDNAIDALANGTARKRLHVSVGRSRDRAWLDVTDSGPGVPPDALSRLFEPFFSMKENGTGLGLAIAKRTVEAHGGRIDAAPAPGAGLRFHLEIPLARAGAP